MTLLSPRVTVADAFRQTFAALLKARYDDSGVELTKASGLSSSTITRLLNGERGASFRVLERVRTAFGVTPAGLFDPGAALAQLGLRRNADTYGQPLDAQGAHVVSSASPTDRLEGGAAVQHADAELLTVLLAYWDAMTPEAREELFLHGRRLRAAAGPADFKRA